MLRNKLKSWRYKHEMTQKEFAEYLGVKYSHYNKWENNRMQPELENVYNLLEKLNCTFQDLFEKIE